MPVGKSPVYITHVFRSARSRWTMLMLALIASLASPGLAVAHGVAHWHSAAEHDHRVESSDEHHHVQPSAVSGHELEGEGEHDHLTGHDDTSRRFEAHDAHDLIEFTAGAADHGHEHDHARVEPVMSSRAETRDALGAPALIAVAPAVPATTTTVRPPRQSWAVAALARPAPDNGPPPTLRAPPTR